MASPMNSGLSSLFNLCHSNCSKFGIKEALILLNNNQSYTVKGGYISGIFIFVHDITDLQLINLL